jgi:hypothetical protein
MAGSGRKTFTAGEVLTASDVNGYLQDQAVMNFAGTAARASAIPTPSEGMVTHVGGGTVEVYDGSAWVSLGGVGNAAISDTPTGSYTGYEYWTFTATGTLNVTTAGLVDVLVIGGGGGGAYGGGGGGGGGYRSVDSVYLPNGAITITVGAGGAASTSSITASPGTPSSIGSNILATAGGGGSVIAATYTNERYSASGASGGGGTGFGGTGVYTLGALGQSGVGNNGGNGFGSATAAQQASGGGGGAGAAGTNATSGVGGNGGSGSSSSITGSSVGRSGGGGGSTRAGSNAGTATDGGGAGGTNGVAGTAGTANTGGGGGGGGYASGGNGGSGIVIVRVAV